MGIGINEMNRALQEEGYKIVPIDAPGPKDHRRNAAILALAAVKKLGAQEARLALEMALRMLRAS